MGHDIAYGVSDAPPPTAGREAMVWRGLPQALGYEDESDLIARVAARVKCEMNDRLGIIQNPGPPRRPGGSCGRCGAGLGRAGRCNVVWCAVVWCAVCGGAVWCRVQLRGG